MRAGGPAVVGHHGGAGPRASRPPLLCPELPEHEDRAVRDADSSTRSPTFIVRVSGEPMQDAGISDGEMTVKRLSTGPREVVLKAENPDYPDLLVAELSDFLIWGVITTCMHHL